MGSIRVDLSLVRYYIRTAEYRTEDPGWSHPGYFFEQLLLLTDRRYDYVMRCAEGCGLGTVNRREQDSWDSALKVLAEVGRLLRKVYSESDPANNGPTAKYLINLASSAERLSDIAMPLCKAWAAVWLWLIGEIGVTGPGEFCMVSQQHLIPMLEGQRAQTA